MPIVQSDIVEHLAAHRERAGLQLLGRQADAHWDTRNPCCWTAPSPTWAATSLGPRRPRIDAPTALPSPAVLASMVTTPLVSKSGA